MLITLVKADQSQRLVFGRIDETPDRAGEVFDYATSKDHFKKWSNEQSVASGGKSFGNLRAMHKAVAAGIIKDIQFDDSAKAITFAAEVVDDDEWNKVQKGVYTGFSPGGKYTKSWKDGAHTRYTAKPGELSLVDRPCIPSATFTMIKADGTETILPFDEAVLAKGGARHSAKDLSHLHGIRDHLSALLDGAEPNGATDGDEANKVDQGGDLAKAHDDLAKIQNALAKSEGDLAKTHDDLAKAQDDLAKVSGEKDILKKRVEELEKIPANGGPRLKSLEKADDHNASTGAATEAPKPDDSYEVALAKVEAMSPGKEKQQALVKLAKRSNR